MDPYDQLDVKRRPRYIVREALNLEGDRIALPPVPETGPTTEVR
jgi:hypothetical protein